MISRFGKYIPIIFLITFVFVIFDSLLSFQELRDIQNNQISVLHSYQNIENINLVLLNLSRANAQQKIYINTLDENSLKKYQKYWKNVFSLIKDLKRDTKDHAQQQNLVKDFENTIGEKQRVLDEEITYIQQGNTTLTFELLDKEDNVMTKSVKLSSRIQQNEKNFLSLHKSEFKTNLRHMFSIIILSALLTLILLVTTYIAIMRELKQRTILEHKKNEFISLASHELKTPITTIGIFSELLTKKIKEKSYKSSLPILDKMTMQIHEMKNLINDLLDVTRVRLGKLEFDKKPVVLNDVIKQTIDEIQPTTKIHKINFKGVKNVTVFADRQRIWQVLANLLNNAIKYSPKGGPINIGLSVKNHSALVTVQDKGIGISRKNIRHIFDRYFREEGNNQTQFSGLGLGLYLSQRIISLHNGNIWAKSTRGKGSKFFFTLPITEKSRGKIRRYLHSMKKDKQFVRQSKNQWKFPSPKV